MEKSYNNGFDVISETMEVADREQSAARRKIDTWIWEGEDAELLRWMGRYGTVPDDKNLIFDSSGENVDINAIECGTTYFTLCRKKIRVRTCQGSAFKRRLVILRSILCGRGRARVVKRKCQQKPSCVARITLHFRGIYCLGNEWNAGYIYKIDCVQL